MLTAQETGSRKHEGNSWEKIYSSKPHLPRSPLLTMLYLLTASQLSDPIVQTPSESPPYELMRYLDILGDIQIKTSHSFPLQGPEWLRQIHFVLLALSILYRDPYIPFWIRIHFYGTSRRKMNLPKFSYKMIVLLVFKVTAEKMKHLNLDLFYYTRYHLFPGRWWNCGLRKERERRSHEMAENQRYHIFITSTGYSLHLSIPVKLLKNHKIG